MIGLFAALPLVWRLGIGLAIIAALATGYGVWHHKVYQSGYSAAIDDIARADEAAIARKNDGVKALSDCRARNGTWDVTTGTCK